MDVGVGPGVGQVAVGKGERSFGYPGEGYLHLTGVAADIGKGIENMGELLGGQVLGTMLAGVDGPEDTDKLAMEVASERSYPHEELQLGRMMYQLT